LHKPHGSWLHLEKKLIPGDDNARKLAEVTKALAELAQELGRHSITYDQYKERQTELDGQYARLAAMPSIPEKWENTESGKTVFQHWQSLDTDGRREWLREHDVVMHVGKNGRDVYAIIDGRGMFGLKSLDVIGTLPGPTLLERAKAKGLDKLVDAEAEQDMP
jgi:hypothetical protein